MSSPQDRADEVAARESPAFTLRAISAGCLCAFAVSAGASYGTLYLQGSFMAYGTSMPAAVFLLFVLTLLVNPFLTLIHPRARLNRQELLVIYVMMVMASPIPTLNFVGPFFSNRSVPHGRLERRGRKGYLSNINDG